MAPFQQLTRECATLAGLTELGDLVEEVELRHEAGDHLRGHVTRRCIEVHAEKRSGYLKQGSAVTDMKFTKQF